MSSEIKKERFGRYLILDHLVDGGMAKICRARFLGEQADKIVAIKMVQPQYSQNLSFKQMFMDEIKLTFGLLHPNIVQTYDYGFHNNQLFVAMEYCDGRNLKQYLDRLKQKKFVFPVEISVYIISQVCQGLHYAHTYTNKLTGRVTNIIHRDISPHNLMLTYDGAIKIIDFGIAKSNTNSESTQAGTIKGKLSYLAPEYLEGMELDHRYDQFAVGNTLWEMLCSRRLFRAPNDLAVLKKIQECNIPAPSSINPNVPKELDEIVLKAMSKDRTKRFENMDQFNRALIKFLYANYPDFNASDLSYFAKELFKEEIKEDRVKLFEYGKIEIASFLNEWKREREGRPLTQTDVEVEETMEKTLSGVPLSSSHRGERMLDLDSQIAIQRPIFNKIEENNKKSLAKEKKSLSLEVNENRERSESRQDNRAKVEDLSQARADKKKKRNSAQSKNNKNEKEANLSGAYATLVLLVLLIYVGYDYLPLIQDKILGNARNPSSQEYESKEEFDKELNSFGGDEREITFSFKNLNKYKQKIYINGVAQQVDILSQVTTSRKNNNFVIRVETPEREHFIKMIEQPDMNRVTINIPVMDDAEFGYLYQSRGCRLKGKIYFSLYGEERVHELPLKGDTGIGFPVRGDGKFLLNSEGKVHYDLFFQNSNQSEQIRTKLILSFDSAKGKKRRIDLCEII